MSDVETPEVETEENPLGDLVQAALDKDYNKANEIFGNAISVKLDDLLDQERVKLAGQIYNGEEDEDEADPEEDDGQIELDLEDEDDSEEEEENSSE